MGAVRRQLFPIKDHQGQEEQKQFQENVEFVILIHGILILLEERPYVLNVDMLQLKI